MEENLDITRLVSVNLFCQSLGPSLYRGSTLLDSGILVGGNWISNSNRKRELGFLELNSLDSGFYQRNLPDSRFHRQRFAGFRARYPESKLPYMAK